MNTTFLFAEILIIGIQAGVWFLLVVIDIFGFTWISALGIDKLSEFQVWVVAVLISFLYMLGIIVDRVTDLLFSRWENNLEKMFVPKSAVPLKIMRYELADRNESLSQSFEYNRSRMRIARASAVNIALFVLFFALLVLLHIPEMAQWEFLVPVFAIGIFTVLLSIFSWWKLTVSYIDLVVMSHTLLSDKSTSMASLTPHKVHGSKLRKKGNN
jgi:hypothetical protein